MGKMKFVYQLLESQDFELFELAAYKAAEEGRDQFVFGNGLYDVKFAANVISYIYSKKAEEHEWEQRHLFGVPESWTNHEL